MPATVTHLRPRTPQPAPSEASPAIAMMRDAWIAEGERRVYARLGIRPPSRPLSSASFGASAGTVTAVLSARWPGGVPG